jgi:hypothetical protein
MISASADNVSHCEIFRTYRSPQSSINCTLMEAVCASLAIPPLFDPVLIGPQRRKQKFIGGALGFYNPSREILKEAKIVYGDDQRVALILSLGSGVPPILSLDSSTSLSFHMSSLVRYIGTDCERVAREMASQLDQVDAYIRLNVTHGFEDVQFDEWSCISSLESCIKSYLQAAFVTRAVDAAAEKMVTRIGSITIDQLSTHIFHIFNVVIITPY